MSKANQAPTFNMKVVVQETGLKPVTLRAWERRYGMPKPQRTAGGHRLYSQHEIDTLKWLVARQEEGLSIKNAIELWHTLIERGENPLAPANEQKQLGNITGDQLDQIRTEWLTSCLNFDEYTAQHTLARAFALFPTETVCFRVLQEGLAEIGRGWYEGTVSVQQEHFTSALAIRQLETLIASMAMAPRRDGRILVACPPKEQHTFSPLLITLLLRQQGWDVVYLGANVPADRLETAVLTIRPKLVILAAQTLPTAGHLYQIGLRLNRLAVPMAFGGGIFNINQIARQHIPGHFLGHNLHDIPQAVTELLQTSPPLPPVKAPAPNYQSALDHYQEQRPAIEAHVYQNINGDSDISTQNLQNANFDLGNHISAALTLGKMELITDNVHWVHGLLVNYKYHMPEQSLQTYLAAYAQGAKQQLDQRGQPILDWFNHVLSTPLTA